MQNLVDLDQGICVCVYGYGCAQKPLPLGAAFKGHSVEPCQRIEYE